MLLFVISNKEVNFYLDPYVFFFLFIKVTWCFPDIEHSYELLKAGRAAVELWSSSPTEDRIGSNS